MPPGIPFCRLRSGSEIAGSRGVLFTPWSRISRTPFFTSQFTLAMRPRLGANYLSPTMALFPEWPSVAGLRHQGSSPFSGRRSDIINEQGHPSCWLIEPFWIFQWVDDIVLVEVDIGDRLQKAEKRLRDGVKLVFGSDGRHEGKFTTWPPTLRRWKYGSNRARETESDKARLSALSIKGPNVMPRAAAQGCLRVSAKWVNEGVKLGPYITSVSPGETTKKLRVSQLIKGTTPYLGLNPKDYSSHSLRIGDACALLAAGKSDLVIRLMGRWSSWCFTVYTRLKPGMIRDAASSMIKASTSELHESNSIQLEGDSSEPTSSS
ncbi:hypothetical protein F441_18347 [Phytophthora nicotianae CJ01A1]|uniref:Tyr recombinase domain-containing protein n=1 Tax=Phytophthora nicotianae CJ01A1 TaxID=1317063 RepID=W2W3H1_PHYNI|nr:hypothetical protein F441_18347 [Phytophthora nicotianae CJ01A1]